MEPSTSKKMIGSGRIITTLSALVLILSAVMNSRVGASWNVPILLGLFAWVFGCAIREWAN